MNPSDRMPVPMKYRRFGRTELQMPVISCGGMRYQQEWKDKSPEEITLESQKNLEATIHRAIEVGINHIETARGYGTSEMQLGQVLPTLNRDKIIVQTKISPDGGPKEFRDNFEKSMSYLGLDHVDLLALHGINNHEVLDKSLRRGGCLEVAREIQREGRARFVGFATHAPTHVIKQAIRTGEFDYINLHWYFVNPLNWSAVEAARNEQDMGVFIISPNDKGGKLYEPPPKMVDLCSPLHPMQFNDLYCLRRPEVHTLSCGAARPSDFDPHIEAVARLEDASKIVTPIVERLNAALRDAWGNDFVALWDEGLPEFQEVPEQINVLEIIRLWLYAKGLDMTEWAKMRYNLLGSGGHWFPGYKADKVGEVDLSHVLRHSPFRQRIPALLADAHAALNASDVKRLSQSDD